MQNLQTVKLRINQIVKVECIFEQFALNAYITTVYKRDDYGGCEKLVARIITVHVSSVPPYCCNNPTIVNLVCKHSRCDTLVPGFEPDE